ncbi:MAG TPA: hypothetical protein PKA00_16460 [Saprospiraceae bacterium]|nr:hypothetical protein [Saprospiraceae bacterium]HMQ84509.1 hypothetical protein [Saprospiraceae bacterium]
MEILLFLLLPLCCIALLFLKDNNKRRKLRLNVLLLLNALLFMLPLLMAYANTPKGESLWNENSGGGAALWLYMLVFPVCFIGLVVLFILKISFAKKSK